MTTKIFELSDPVLRENIAKTIVQISNQFYFGETEYLVDLEKGEIFTQGDKDIPAIFDEDRVAVYVKDLAPKEYDYSGTIDWDKVVASGALPSCNDMWEAYCKDEPNRDPSWEKVVNWVLYYSEKGDWIAEIESFTEKAKQDLERFVESLIPYEVEVSCKDN
jgi:hypothetical protein